MTLFAYLDEFGDIGPYIGRQHPKYNESPVFGLAGFVLPAEVVRGFGTWFFQRKCELLAFEIERSGTHPALWEKKGASFYTLTNVTRYPELRRFTNRLFNKIERLGGFVFYVGVRKTAAPGVHNPNRLYARVFLEAIKRIDGHCAEDREPPEGFVLILDGLGRSDGMARERCVPAVLPATAPSRQPEERNPELRPAREPYPKTCRRPSPPPCE
ncbi:MAG: DUF3800 domain-containing protein [Gammaproteobacteria bacterium]|nr:DUF3800 domain-containing protein [Gammaproteobacteria bacterium]